ncbi:protein ENHANCED PSEUDOMONAS SUSCEPTIBILTY 1-like [Papaver somniferum]|nr:protein ENHANCED PSEUDOMONAS SUSCEPTIBILTY 1-like [Papaver somniferum]
MNQQTSKNVVRQISKCTIKPHQVLEESKKTHYLTPWDLPLFNLHYIQIGLLYRKPAPTVEDPNPTITFIDQLKHSMSITLTHFYPLSGRMVTKQQDNPPFYGIYVDCTNDSVGAEFIHAAVDISMMDILTPVYVPRIIQSFFSLEGANCHDGHTEPLLGIQVTELLDGIFVGCSFSHVIGDGTSFWKFFNALAETNRKLRKASKEAGDQHIGCDISSLPITKRWFMEDPILINLPFSHHKEFIERYERPLLRERMFHFTEESLAKLKAKANEECGIKYTEISSFQALSAFVWRSMTRARHFTSDRKTECRLVSDNRLRMNPPISENYFGNCARTVCGSTTVGELLEHGIGWAAMLLHEAVMEYTDEKIRVSREEWMRKPYILQMGPSLDAASVMMGGSPKFDVYGCDFGLGTAVAARSGSANKFDGKVTAYRGLTGIRSVMLEICLPHESMSALESDAEFMDVVSPHEIHSEILGVNNRRDGPVLGKTKHQTALSRL